MIPDIKFVRKVLSVNQIPNQIPHINIPKSTHNTPKAIENPVISTMIFTVLLITPMISSLLHSSQILARSKYQNNLFFKSLEIKSVKITTMIVKIIFNSNSVEKNEVKVVIKSCVWLTSQDCCTAKV